MESDVVHQQLNGSSDSGTRNMLICYLQYLMDYRRDVPDMDEHVTYELQRLLSTKYVRQLEEDDPVHQIIRLAEELELADMQQGKTIWSTLNRSIPNLR